MPAAGGYFLDGNVVRNAFIQRSVEQTETRTTLRLDHSISESTKANFRYTKTPAIGIRGSGNDRERQYRCLQ
jgi:hypothetical protein